MKLLGIAIVALKRFIRDRSNLFFVFILPIGIIILIGAQFGGDLATRVGVHTPAGAGPIAQEIVASLEDSGEINPTPYETRAALEEAIARGSVARGIAFPDDLSARLAAGETLAIEIIGPEGGFSGATQMLLSRAVGEVTAPIAATRFAVGEGADPAAAEAAVASLRETVPRIDVAGESIGAALFENVGGQFEIGATSQLVLFMFLTGLTGSAALIQARNYGVIRRMLGTPTAPATVVGGEALGRYAVVLVQGLYIVIATMVVFQVDWGNLLGAAAVILVFGASAAAAAMLFGTLFKKDDQAAIVGVVTGLGLAALGGCMMPLELFGPTLETVARFTPHAWANDAFADLLRRDATIVDILPQLGVLAAFAAVLIGLAAWRMAATLKSP